MKKLRVLGNQRLTSGGIVKRAKPARKVRQLIRITNARLWLMPIWGLG